MSRAGIDQLLYLMDSAFEGVEGQGHALMANLRSVTEEDWSSVPPKGDRSIAHIVAHVAAAKHMYDHYAFGEGRWTWNDPPFSDEALFVHEHPMPELTGWLKEGQRVLREHVAALEDSELLTPRKTNWGELYETRRIIAIMIEHDLYHGGEINHIRALRQGTDRWAWQQG